ncbi:DNA-binding transcription repressor [Mortierella claussenii]|nr:DNA-binding transcription repressor [Mortierella claussenii]
MASPVSAGSPTLSSHAHHTEPSRRMRFSLSSLQSPSSNGSAHLTQKDIEALQRKGLLPAAAASSTSTPTLLTSTTTSTTTPTSSATTKPTIATTTTSGSPIFRSSTPSLFRTTLTISEQQQLLCTRPPLPIAARVAPLNAAYKSSSKQARAASKPVKVIRGGNEGKNTGLVIQYKERPLPAYHQGVIEDTCSHLHVLGGGGAIRRHSDSSTRPLASSSVASSADTATTTSVQSPRPEDTLTLDHIRRASIATASPVVPSPLGGRTVLYKASYAHTLLSLPSKTAYAESSLDLERTATTGPTAEMNSFKFPAEENSRRSKTPTSPALMPVAGLTGMSPTLPYRSKRKSSIPMRSPSWSDTQDVSPGVVFRLPFGTPPLPSTPFRKATTPSAQLSSSSTAVNSLMQEQDVSQAGSSGGSTPPTSYPSPASSNRAASASGPSDAQDQQLQHGQTSIQFETPPSPANRSGLGIQVQESFVEAGATHPLESSTSTSSLISVDANTVASSSPSSSSSSSHSITFREEDSNMSIGDIIVAEQASAAQRLEARLVGLSSGGVVDRHLAQIQLGSMPTPPPTSRVLSMRTMEVSGSERQFNSSQVAPLTEGSPLTPFTPGSGYAVSREAAAGSLQNPFQIVRSTMEQSVVKNLEIISSADDVTMNQDPEHHGSPSDTTRSGSSPSKDDQEENEDDLDKDSNEHQDDDEENPSLLPLWAQRQNHIRRQSLIPRPELDFVKGSGILPPANKGLVTLGGAKILSYPVLISDMVHVALDELQAKGGGLLEGSDISEESEEDLEQQQQQQLFAKGNGKFAARAAKTIGGAKLSHHSKRKKGVGGSSHLGKRRGSTATGSKTHQAHHHNNHGDDDYQSGDEYVEDIDSLEDQGGQQGGYMTSQLKRRRISQSKHHGVEGGETSSFLAPTRSVPERHGPSIYRRRGSHAVGRHSSSPSSSPQMGTTHFSGVFRKNNGGGLGSPVDLNQNNVFEDEEGDVVMDEGGGVVEIGEEEEDYQHQHEHHQHRHHGSHPKSQRRDGRRHSQVPEHLRIPASELDIAVQLTKEMMATKKRAAQKKEKASSATKNSSGHASHRHSLKTLKPLLDATMKEDGLEHHHENDNDDNDDEDDEHDKDGYHGHHHQQHSHQHQQQQHHHHQQQQHQQYHQHQAGGSLTHKGHNNGAQHSGSTTATSTGSKKSAAKVSSSMSNADPATVTTTTLKRVTKPKEGKMTTKRCEACGASETPCWRPGYTAHSALCNSCGLRYKKSNVFCAKVGCKYIPLKTEYAAMEAERVKAGRAHLLCHKCKGPVALPIPKD